MFLLFVLTCIFAVFGFIWRGYVLSVVWGWFVVPFFGLPALSIPMGIGLIMIVSFMTYQYNYHPDDRPLSQKLGAAAGNVFLYPLLVLGIGWIVLQFL